MVLTMSVSYAALHREQHLKAKHGSTPAVLAAEKSRQHYLSAERVRFDIDRAQLSQMRSINRRIERKRDLIGNYRDYIQLVVSDKTTCDDEIFVVVAIWCIDAGEYALALQMARYALENGLNPPEGFNRQLPEIFAEEFAEQVLKSSNPEAFTDCLQQLYPLLQKQDMADQARAKYYKALGLSLHESEPDKALIHYQEALKHNSKISVKRFMKQLEKLKDTEEG